MTRIAEKLDQPKAPAQTKGDGWPKFLKSRTEFGYTDPDSNIHFTPATPMKIDAAPKEGSWLHSQMAAGLIGEA